MKKQSHHHSKMILGDFILFQFNFNFFLMISWNFIMKHDFKAHHRSITFCNQASTCCLQNNSTLEGNTFLKREFRRRGSHSHSEKTDQDSLVFQLLGAKSVKTDCLSSIKELIERKKSPIESNIIFTPLGCHLSKISPS